MGRRLLIAMIAVALVAGSVAALSLGASPPPTAVFSYAPASPVTGGPVTFTATPSATDCPCTYAWSDDGSTTRPMPPLWPLGTGNPLSFTFHGAGTKHVRLVVTGTDGQTASVEHNVVVGSPPSAVAPSYTVRPAISGTPQQGDTLTATTGTWTGTTPITYTYQWQDEGTAIPGALGSRYTLAASDLRHVVYALVTARNVAGTSSVLSNGLGPVTGPPPNGCTTTVSSSAAAASAVTSAAPGGVVCLTAGTYPGFTISGPHTGNVTLEPVPGQAAKIALNSSLADGHGNTTIAVLFAGNASHVVLHGFTITGMVELLGTLTGGPSFITIDHNDISGGNEGVYIFGQDCTVPHSPSWAGCANSILGPVTDVSVSGNRLHGFTSTGLRVGQADAFNINNYRRLRITGNEITGVIEGGNHNDCLQSTFGGTDLTFDHNYEHDNNCQGFFLKDGDVHNATVTDNLFVRDSAGSNGGMTDVTFIDTYNAVYRNNTDWTGHQATLRADAAGRYALAFDHNVQDRLYNGCATCGSLKYGFVLTEGRNVFQLAPYPFTMASSDVVNASPAFVRTATDDYRLASNPNAIGVDWRPADQHYGP